MSRSFRVPASTANLGAGFDTLSLALGIYLKVEVDTESQGGGVAIEAHGVDSAKIPSSGDNLILRVAAKVAERRGRALPGFRVVIDNEIPLARGLGSSAAAIVAGITCYELVMADRLSADEVYRYAQEFESHPDNLAASLAGGLVAAGTTDDGGVVVSKLNVFEGLCPVIVIPDFELSTLEARRVLPASYSRDDVVFNLQRSVLTLAALTTGNTEILREAMRDRVHQPYRADLVPGLREILALETPGLLGVALSGAGPSVLAMTSEENARAVGQAIALAFACHDVRARTLIARVDRNGRSFLGPNGAEIA